MARGPERGWKQLDRLNAVWALLFSQPVLWGASVIIAVLGQHVPLISAFGGFGMAVTCVASFLLLSACAALQAYAKRNSRKAQQEPAGRFHSLIRWKWWPRIILIVCVVVGAFFIDTRPKLPQDFNPSALSLPIATYREMRAATIVGRTVLISEVPRDGAFIKGKTFSQCHIIGPAVLAPTGHFLFEMNAILAPGAGKEGAILETHGNAMSGMIFLKDCVFTMDTFEIISFAGTKEAMDKLRNGTTAETP
jgi:hypothetical protein